MRRILLRLLMTLFIIMTCVLVITSCDMEDKKQVQLITPEVTLNGDTVTWSTNTSAVKFEISVNRIRSYVEGDVTSMTLSRGQSFKIRAIGDGEHYSNSEWSDVVIYMTSKPSADITYTVTWKNGSVVLETDENVKAGETPTYNGTTPTKEADAQYTYTFKGWSPQISPVTGNVTYEAQFESVVNTYNVTFYSEDGSTVLYTATVPYGETPTYNGTTPTKEADAQYTYTFKSWSPQISPVTGNITYEAQFESIVNTYNVTFYSEDGSTVLYTATVPYGQSAIYNGTTPNKSSTPSTTYTFSGWVNTKGGSTQDNLTNVVSDRSVYAYFKETVKKVNVYINSSNSDFGVVSVEKLENIEYGTSIEANGNQLTIGDNTVVAIAKGGNSQYTYKFTGWDAKSTVDNETVITANFERETRRYTVTWKNGDTILETDNNVPYGTVPNYNGAIPTKESNGSLIYTFSGWSPNVSTVTGNATYEAQFSSEENKHVVIFYDENGTTELGRAVVAHGATAVYPNALPTKAATMQTVYTFDKWVSTKGGNTQDDLTNVVSDRSVYAYFKETVKKVSVFIKSINTDFGKVSVDYLENVEYGTSIVVNGNQVKIGDNTVLAIATGDNSQYTYKFIGWDAKSTVDNETVITANFERETRRYTVTWKNGNTILETDNNVPYGTVPNYNGSTPTKASNGNLSYTFSGWSPSISGVTGNATYEAQFSSAENNHIVIFYNENGTTELGRAVVAHGATAVYPNALPTKAATMQTVYTFDKWVSAKGGSVEANLTNIVSDISVYASFKESVKKVSVSITSSNNAYGNVSVNTLENIEYGASIEVKGNQVIIGGNTVTAVPTEKTAQYTYKFTGWDTTKSTVDGNTVITANFAREINTYTVTWKNGNTTLETDNNVPYGTVPNYNGATPTKATSGNLVYTFSGWSPSISEVTENVTYVAQFSSVENNHVVIFYDENGTTELGRAVVAHGATAVYPNVLPTKAATAQTVYTFDKWVSTKGGATEAKLTNVTEDKSVYAKYSSSARKYKVTFCDYDGTVLLQSDIAYGGTAVAPADPEREGYRFNGWDKTFTNITGELIVRATYIQQFTVTFVDYDNSVIDTQVVDYNGNASAPQNPTRENYRFKGWSTEFTNVKHNLTVKAEYIRQYTVTFFDYDGNPIKTVKVDEGSTVAGPSAPSKTGYTFDKWYYDAKFTKPTPTSIVANDSVAEIVNGVSIIKIWGKWTANTYNVTLNTNGGTIVSGNVTNYVYGTGATLPIAVRKNGYVFAGWYTANNGQGKFTTSISKTDVNSKTFYAYWVEDKNYSLTVDGTSVSVSNCTKSEPYAGNTSFNVVVPDELKNMLSTGRLKVRITLSCDASLQYRSNEHDATATIKAFLGNGSYQELASITAKGGGWPWNWVDPKYGAAVTSGDSISEEFELSSTTTSFNMGYQYVVSFEEHKNWAGGTHAVNFSCDISDVSYQFYVE